MKLKDVVRRARTIKRRVLLLHDFIARPPVRVDAALRRIGEIVKRVAP